MNTLELKNIVISQILRIEDKSLLEALKIILDTKTPDIRLNDLQKEEIAASRKAITEGNFKDGEILDKEIMQWLSEK